MYGITELEGYKNRTHSQDKAKAWWITHLDEVRCDPTAEVKRRFLLIFQTLFFLLILASWKISVL